MEKAEKIGIIIARMLKTAGGTAREPEREPGRKNPYVDWEKIWAETLRDAIPFCYVIGCDDNVLKVKVKSSAWFMELKRRKDQLKKDLEKRTGVHLKNILFLR